MRALAAGSIVCGVFRLLRSHRKLIGVGVACALIGSVAGIAVTSANTDTPSRHRFGPFGFGLRGPGAGRAGTLGIGGAPVHGELVVPNSAGNGFVTVTFDRGTFKSVSGDQLTITE